MRACGTITALLLAALTALFPAPGAARESSAARRVDSGVPADSTLGRELAAVVDVLDRGGAVEGRHFVVGRVLSSEPGSDGGWTSRLRVQDLTLRADPLMETISVPLPFLLTLGPLSLFMTVPVARDTGEDLESGALRVRSTAHEITVRSALPPGQLVALWLRPEGETFVPEVVLPGTSATDLQGLDPLLLHPPLEVDSLYEAVQLLRLPVRPEASARAWREFDEAVKRRGETLPDPAAAALARASSGAPPEELARAALPRLRAQVDAHDALDDRLALARIHAELGEVGEATDLLVRLRPELPSPDAFDLEIAQLAYRAERWDLALRHLAGPAEDEEPLAIHLCTRLAERRADLVRSSACAAALDEADPRRTRERTDAPEPQRMFEARPERRGVRHVDVRGVGFGGLTLRFAVDFEELQEPARVTLFLNPPAAGWSSRPMERGPDGRWFGEWVVPLEEEPGKVYFYVVARPRRGPVARFGNRVFPAKVDVEEAFESDLP